MSLWAPTKTSAGVGASEGIKHSQQTALSNCLRFLCAATEVCASLASKKVGGVAVGGAK